VSRTFEGFLTQVTRPFPWDFSDGDIAFIIDNAELFRTFIRRARYTNCEANFVVKDKVIIKLDLTEVYDVKSS